MNPSDLCARCDHPRARHCAGGIDHIHSYKGNQEYHVTCHTRHCLNPLCSCIDFVERSEAVAASLERDPPLTERERRQELGIRSKS